jgi:acetyl esterase/lipase
LKKYADRYNLDPDRMIVWGESAGATIAQILTFSDPGAFPGDPELKDFEVKPLAGISWYGPSDFTGLVDHDQENSVKTRMFRYITGKNSYSAEDEEVLRALSPIYLVNKNSSPSLLMQGDNDHAVDISQATFLNARAREMEAEVDLLTVLPVNMTWRRS